MQLGARIIDSKFPHETLKSCAGTRKFGGSSVKKTTKVLLWASLGVAAPASAQPAPPVSVALAPASMAIAPDVAAAYDTYHIQPIWFRGGVDNVAVGQLVAILQRAAFDGFADGPQLAAQVQAAVSQARTDPQAAAQADRALSTAWVHYVQAIKRPTTGMI